MPSLFCERKDGDLYGREVWMKLRTTRFSPRTSSSLLRVHHEGKHFAIYAGEGSIT